MEICFYRDIVCLWSESVIIDMGLRVELDLLYLYRFTSNSLYYNSLWYSLH